jgi:hypothetical protein
MGEGGISSGAELHIVYQGVMNLDMNGMWFYAHVFVELYY